MENGNLHTLIPLADFQALLGIDDREDKLSRFCLVTSTLTIEQYCKRRFLKKSHTDYIPFFGDLLLQLNEYPVNKIIAIFSMSNEQGAMSNGIIVEPEFYRTIPDCGTDIDIPFSIEFSPAVARMGCKAVKVVYWAGYSMSNEKLAMSNEKKMRGYEVPADLAAACLELASWNLNRYRGKHIGMNVSGGKEGGHFEMSMPENVKGLLAPYVRRTI